MLARWERQLQKLPRPVDQLTGGNVRGAADAGTLHISALRLHQKQLRGAAGQMPGKMGFLHQIHPSRAPQRRGHMPLLVRNLHQRHAQSVRQQLCMGIAHHEAGHIAPLHRPGTGADAHRRDGVLPNMGKQPAGKLRQAFDMSKYRVGLTQTQLPLPDGQKAGAILAPLAVKKSDGGGVIAGVNADDAHLVSSWGAAASVFRLRTKLPKMPLINAPVSSPSYFFAMRTASATATPVGTSST